MVMTRTNSYSGQYVHHNVQDYVDSISKWIDETGGSIDVYQDQHMFIVQRFSENRHTVDVDVILKNEDCDYSYLTYCLICFG